jgi:hypothetical protein
VFLIGAALAIAGASLFAGAIDSFTYIDTSRAATAAALFVVGAAGLAGTSVWFKRLLMQPTHGLRTVAGLLIWGLVTTLAFWIAWRVTVSAVTTHPDGLNLPQLYAGIWLLVLGAALPIWCLVVGEIALDRRTGRVSCNIFWGSIRVWGREWPFSVISHIGVRTFTPDPDDESLLQREADLLPRSYLVLVSSDGEISLRHAGEYRSHDEAFVAGQELAERFGLSCVGSTIPDLTVGEDQFVDLEPGPADRRGHSGLAP